MIGLACVLVIVAFIVTKPKIIRTNLHWAVLGIVVSAAMLVLITQFGLLLRHTWLTAPLFHNSLVVAVIGNIIKQLSITTVPEEILFRGFVWGYLRRKGWGENKIIWTQGVLFWLIHFSRLGTPFSFFVIIPVLTVISSQLTKRSKQVFPAILSHTIINVVSAILNLTAF
jgi:membrane protease YdiL (CAAX protease family)